MSFINSLRPRPNGRHFADDIFKFIFENENEWILPRISLKFVPKVRINNIPALVQIMAWRPPGDKPLSEPMMVSFLMHICITRPQWVNSLWCYPISFDITIFVQEMLLKIFCSSALLSFHLFLSQYGLVIHSNIHIYIHINILCICIHQWIWSSPIRW